MPALPSLNTAESNVQPGKSYLIPLILVTSLFFLWGLAYGLLDVLNKHFQEALNVTKTRSTLLQAAYFGAYFLISLPAGIFMTKFGYKKGIITGLILYAAGALLFYPAASVLSFDFFLISLFILASGLTFLETAANPYITVLGKPETSEFRLNLSQSFNGVGAFIGPIIGASLFFNEGGAKASNDLSSIQTVYLVIGGLVLLIAAFFWRTPMPEISEGQLVSNASQDSKPLFKHKNFTGAFIAQFFYVAAQVGIAALFINYCTEAGVGIDNQKAAYLLSVSLVLFTIGRFVGTALMKKIAPNVLLFVYAIINVVLCSLVVWTSGHFSVYALMSIFFFESIMFPTIFALGVKDLGHHTRKGASFIIMSIVGGALMPYVMGILSEKGTATSYIVPLFCFVVVAWYGWRGYKTK
ncbi:MAG: L-fucose:H+ symporter permease [Bacteroidetes bacterium]|nr:L-fucose:H+ symporter permease [Bacteroidota bacterium]